MKFAFPYLTKAKLSSVYLRRRGGRTSGRIEVSAASLTSAERMALDQLIAVSFPKTKRADWIVTSVEELTCETTP